MRKLLLAVALSLSLAALALSASLSAQAPVPVLVTSVGAVNGFTDPSTANRKTVKRLKDNLRKAKEIRLVESAEDARLVLTVQPDVYGAKHTSIWGVPTDDVKIRVRLQAGTLDTEFIEDWMQGVARIGQQVRDWIAANRVNLQP